MDIFVWYGARVLTDLLDTIRYMNLYTYVPVYVYTVDFQYYDLSYIVVTSVSGEFLAFAVSPLLGADQGTGQGLLAPLHYTG